MEESKQTLPQEVMTYAQWKMTCVLLDTIPRTFFTNVVKSEDRKSNDHYPVLMISEKDTGRNSWFFVKKKTMHQTRYQPYILVEEEVVYSEFREYMRGTAGVSPDEVEDSIAKLLNKVSFLNVVP